ncbi:MAG TPA: hypothetical protein PKC39_16050 [Ferruginibacter sp.]|nr:hypothetical protein [Ferruginibacter sp.]HMP22470.1 hypothetical protein [Ferruginibacter sp.]
MVALDEYLGKLVSSLSRARVLADIESAKIAQTYAENNLLKHFSIPRMRIVDVELTIPVAVCDLLIEDKRKIRFIDKRKVADLTYSVILRSLNLKSLPDNLLKDFELGMHKQIDVLISQINDENYEQLILNYIFDISKFIKRLIDSTFTKDSLKSIDSEFIESNIVAKLKEALTNEIKFYTEGKELVDLNVIAETDKLKEKNINNLLIIKMKVSEESMTWERIDDGQGNVINKLMPE